MDRFEIYHWIGKKLKKQTNSKENGLEIFCDVLSLCLLFSCILFCILFPILSVFLLQTACEELSNSDISEHVHDTLPILFTLCLPSGASRLFFRQRMLPLLPCSITVGWCQYCLDASSGFVFSPVQWLTNYHTDPAAAYTYVTLNSGSFKENKIALLLVQGKLVWFWLSEEWIRKQDWRTCGK